jgi:hypothetical protein
MLHPLIFLHLPKAAGTSFKFALQELLPPGTLMYAVNGDPNREVVRALMAMDPKQRAELKAIMAHVPYGLHTLFPRAKYVTILREPIARVLSTYYFAKSRTEFDFSRKIAAGMTIEEFAADVFNENAQVRRLMKYPDISREDVFFDPPAGQLTHAHLDDAKDTLRRCAVVGLAERYDKFLDGVSAEFGLPPISCRDDNVTALPWHREEIPERTIERLLGINQLDVDLYEYAKQVAKQAIKPAGARHMRPLYERASAREALEAENRRLKTELVDQGTERERAAADLARYKEESALLATEWSAERERFRVELSRQHSELSRQQAELSQQHGELSRQQAELSRQHGELSRQQAELSRQHGELLRLQAELSRQRVESAHSETQLNGTIDTLQLQLNRMYSSNSWKITEPFRKLSKLTRKARRSR